MALDVLLQELFLAYGPVGLFLAAIIANATIFFPVPLDFFMLGLGAFLRGTGTDIFIVSLLGLVAGTGAAIGEMTSYILGLLGVNVAERAKHEQFRKIEEVNKKINDRGMLFIALGALTPFPFDIIGIAAGLIKYDPRKFFFAALLGKLARYLLIIFAGYYGWSAVQGYFLF